ncbi:GerAB/ArcD/ProY family transporter [Bacillus sp. JJ634]
MKQQAGKLGIREYVSIVILMVGTKATESTPTTLYSHLQNAAWMIPILSGAIFSIPLFLLLKTLSVFQGKNLFDVIRQLLGKYIGFFVCLLIFIINSLAMSADSREYTDIIRSFYFKTTPNLIIYALLMFICAYGAKKGIQHIGSVAYLIIFLVTFSFYLVLLLSTQGSNLESIFPIWGSGKLEILKESSHGLTLFASFFILTMVIPYITSYKDFRKGTWFSFIYIIIILSAAMFIFICLFDMTLQGMAYPFHTTIRYISFGNFLGNIETLFFPIWLLSAFIRFAAFLYINSLMFGHLFKIKDFEFLIPSLATIYLLIGMIPETAIDVSLGFKAPVQYMVGPTFTAICILLWLVALFKGEFKHEKNKNSM